MNFEIFLPLVFIVLIVFFPLYYLWGEKRIKLSKKETIETFIRFENSLEHRVDEYQAYTNNHPYVWGKINYKDIRKAIIESAKWRFSVNFIYADKADLFSLNVNEDKAALYIVRGDKNYDWNRLLHYKEWLESKAPLKKAIKEYNEKNKNL